MHVRQPTGRETTKKVVIAPHAEKKSVAEVDTQTVRKSGPQ